MIAPPAQMVLRGRPKVELLLQYSPSFKSRPSASENRPFANGEKRSPVFLNSLQSTATSTPAAPTQSPFTNKNKYSPFIINTFPPKSKSPHTPPFHTHGRKGISWTQTASQHPKISPDSAAQLPVPGLFIKLKLYMNSAPASSAANPRLRRGKNSPFPPRKTRFFTAHLHLYL
jgi:hypothetical protein